MKKIAANTLLVAAMGWCLIQPAVANELRWLNYSPVRYFTDQDWEMAKSAARQALNDAKDGETVEWKNPKSQNYGSLTPLSSTNKKGTTCRELKIVNHANHLDGSSVYEFCQKPDGKWGATKGDPGAR